MSFIISLSTRSCVYNMTDEPRGTGRSHALLLQYRRFPFDAHSAACYALMFLLMPLDNPPARVIDKGHPPDPPVQARTFRPRLLLEQAYTTVSSLSAMSIAVVVVDASLEMFCYQQ